MRTCQKCGAEVERDDKFCPECGEKVVKEARTITVSTVFKTIAMIIFLIILVNVFKSMSGASPIMFLIFILLFIIWSGVLNWFLGKLFSVKISTGVKLIITIAILLILFYGANMATKTSAPMIRVGPVEGNDMSNFISRLNDVVNARDNNLLMSMMEEGAIAPEIVKDIRILIDKKDLNIIFKFQGQNVNDNKIDAKVIVIIKTLYEERVEGVQFFFERTDRGWMLVAIEPRLSNIKLSKSFEEAVESKIEKIPKPAGENNHPIVKVTPESTKEGY